MANGWTPERRARQAMLIRQWQPWKLAGVKTPEGKARSSQNALKHGNKSAAAIAQRKMLNAMLRELRASEKAIRELL